MEATAIEMKIRRSQGVWESLKPKKKPPICYATRKLEALSPVIFYSLDKLFASSESRGFFLVAALFLRRDDRNRLYGTACR